jgi:hypothetical protein
MCKKQNCPKASDCYRYRASPEQDQLYNDFPLMCDKDDNYMLHMNIRPDDKVVEFKEVKEIDEVKNEEDNK